MLDALNVSRMLIAATETSGGKGGHHFYSFEGLMVYTGLTLAIVIGVLSLARNGITPRYFTNWFTQRLEQLYLFIENLCVGIVGSHGRHYVPLVCSIWLIIFFANLVGLFFPYTPSMDLSFNLALAFIAVGYVQWEGMRANGVGGHFIHFSGPKLGVALIPISIMIFMIEIISEVMKNVSLSVRLYGNIFGGHEATDAMNALGAKMISLGNGQYLGVPFGAFLLPIKLLTCLVQALVFCLLFCVYLSLVTHHDEDHGSDGDHAPAHA